MSQGSKPADSEIEFIGASGEFADGTKVMAYQTVQYVLEDNVATIYLARPDALNALSLQLAKDLRHAVEKSQYDGARAVILTGTGRAFCAGGDLREMRSMGEEQGSIEAFLDEPLKELHEVILAIREAPVPFVAAVNGVCAGAGTNFALACDIVFASDDASFNEAFVRIGLSPDCGGSFFLPRAVGEKLAAEMLMTGSTVSAQRAFEIGMINRVVPAAELMSEAQKFASQLAAGPTAAIARVKRMLNATFSNDLAAQLQLEADCQVESGASPDFKEGVAAFFEKRPPNFSGE